MAKISNDIKIPYYNNLEIIIINNLENINAVFSGCKASDFLKSLAGLNRRVFFLPILNGSGGEQCIIICTMWV